MTIVKPDAIIQRSRSGQYSLIIMGSQGKGFNEALLQGSVACEVARHAAIPVLFIPAARRP
jgi:nucleotide-binding universal stress UspA family protein